jgi:hypothetical protein
MHGARKIARDYIHPLITSPEIRLLDVACGDRWVQKELPTCNYVGWDKTSGEDLVKMDCEVFDGWVDHGQAPDLILSVYGICTLLGEEARVWTLLRRIAKPTTKFVYVGRHFRDNPHREMKRNDPINGYDCASLTGLALASGWKVTSFKAAWYDGEAYGFVANSTVALPESNAFAATMEPIL